MGDITVTDRITNLVERTLMPCAIGVVLVALGASVQPLAASSATSLSFGCFDIGCGDHQKCLNNGCDVCHTDKRCGLIPGS